MKVCANDSPDKQILLPMAPLAACAASGSETELNSPRPDQAFVTGAVAGPSGMIPQVSSALTCCDRWGSIKARWGVGRMDYAVDPGLYALGSPDDGSPVLATANYKMSFDCLREALPGRDAWLLVLDTEGINVWCAAGKGTFGTEELVRRITASGLKDIVKHRDLILPQLGAPGVSAHLVRKQSGFKVHYGPILARDAAAYLDAGLRATEEMRRKTFPVQERVVLIPIELVATLKPAMIIIPLLLLISSFGGAGGFLQNMAHDGIFSVLAFLCAIFSGAVLTPLLLPYLPGRAFTTKGFAVGVPIAVALIYAWGGDLLSWRGILFGGAWLLLIPAFSAYLAMNFTGASTYTSLSGVRREMRWALPLEIGAGLSGFAALLVSRFF
jgi:acetyl-CoA decarbonylase/synthase complex subunit gamma